MNNIDIAMAQYLDIDYINAQIKNEKIKAALANLDKTAGILDNMSLFSGSEALTQIIEKVAGKIK